jgi:cell division protein FtsW (lipid II flippase)
MQLFNQVLGTVVRIMLLLVFAFCLYQLFAGRLFWYFLASLSLLALLSLRAFNTPEKAWSNKRD